MMRTGKPEPAGKVNLWAELPSPMKTDFREAFYTYAAGIYRKEKRIINAYVPAAMGACMPEEDYLIHMQPEELPDVYLCMSYGECSSGGFISRLLDTGVYAYPRPWCYFPELIAADLVQLEMHGVKCPESYNDLIDPAYEGLICLIGNRNLPDPMLPLYIYHRYGREGLKALCKNIRGTAGPSSTIRYIGKEYNPYGAIFVMPALFTRICLEKRNVRVIVPESGVLAEPIIYLKKTQLEKEDENTAACIDEFLFSEQGMQTALIRMLTPAGGGRAGSGSGSGFPVDPFCRTHLLYPELENVTAFMKEYLSKL